MHNTQHTNVEEGLGIYSLMLTFIAMPVPFLLVINNIDKSICCRHCVGLLPISVRFSLGTAFYLPQYYVCDVVFLVGKSSRVTHVWTRFYW